MNARTQDFLFLACNYRLSILYRFRVMPNITAGDNWEHEERLIFDALEALEAGRFSEVSKDVALQVLIGLEHVLVDGFMKNLDSDSVYLNTHKMLTDLVK